jgi:hypothetical protein
MNHLFRKIFFITLILCPAASFAAQNQREPHIGYLYPAGGKQGTTVKITVGGQFIRDINDVYISGQGVQGKISKSIGRIKPLNMDQRQELQRQLSLQRQKLQAVARGRNPARGQNVPARNIPPADPNKPPVVLPDHPLLNNLDKLTLKGLQKVQDEFLVNRNPSSQAISEIAVLEIKIDANAPPGDRQLRLVTRTGLTNPLCFQIGTLTEFLEPQFLDPGNPVIPKAELPAVLNGQILQGEVDHFRFHANQGDTLVIQAQARHLIPFIADAVPGWFQPTISLRDSSGKEVAYADDWRFDPDPVLSYKIRYDGIYDLEIKDAIYRGREDFIYRITVGELPFITQSSLLGGQTGVSTVAEVGGWNLIKKEMPLDTSPGNNPIRKTQLRQGRFFSNPVIYSVDSLPECIEKENNDKIKDAQQITLPQIINGCISKSGDVDTYKFTGRLGELVSVDVQARRLNSPLDSLLRIFDESGNCVAWNDDSGDKNIGLLTHNADSYLQFHLPGDGNYFVQISDSQNHGGDSFAYRLRISPPQPDFMLYMTPSGINLSPGETVILNIVALRKDGFNGEIKIYLKDEPPGFILNGGRIGPERDNIRLTLTAPPRAIQRPVVLQLQGSANIESQVVTKNVIPAEDMMQAFFYHHIVPAEQLLASVVNARPRRFLFERVGPDIVEIPDDGTAFVWIRLPRNPIMTGIQLELSEPPQGISIQDINSTRGEVTFRLKADANTIKPGFSDNLIVQAFNETISKNRADPNKIQKVRNFVGILPAIPFQITKQ